MKIKSILLLCCIALTSNIFAQAPDVINYQAIVRDVNNTVIANQSVSVKFVITEGLPTGTVVYEEDQSPTTNSHGLINLKIGTGAFVTGTLAAIDWSANSYYLTTSIDPTGGSNYTLSGVSELVSVPYALHAKTVDDKDDADADPANEIQDLQLVGSDLSITNNGSATIIDLSPLMVDTDTQLDESEVDAFVANNGYLTTEVDGSVTNEIELPAGGANGQILQTDGSGNYAWVNKTVDTDTQLDETDVDAMVSNNGYLTSFTEVDGSVTNEIELPTGGSNGQVLQTDGSGNYTWVNQTTDTDTQLNEAAVDGFVANNGYLTSFTEVDGSTTNEIQTLSISGSDLTISGTGGNTVTLPSASGPTFAVGQYHEGGIIIFVDSTGLHGLIAAESDLGSFQFQTGGQNALTSANSLTDGQANTNFLTASGNTYSAADACAASTLGGQNDWYLPSYTEFIILYNNLYVLEGYNVQNFYWTSSFVDPFGTTGYMYALSGAANLSYDTNTFCSVRAIRKF